ncbi:MAG TPA: helix-turn-helix domain-containing protein [Acidimicrobiales bacterium]
MATPVGRAAVVEALLDAAEAELAEVGVTAASVRRIARRAGVNHGLVHRHFGAKDRLVAAVLDRLAARTAAAIDTLSTADLLDPAGPLGRHLRVLARAALDGVDLAAAQSSHPVADHLVARLGGDDAARRAAARLMALAFGVHLFGPFIAEATGIEVTEVARSVTDSAAVPSSPSPPSPSPPSPSPPSPPS